MSGFSDFLSRFQFRPEGGMLVGIEREALLVRNNSMVPIAKEVLEALKTNGRYGYELSACQLEDRIGPVDLQNLLLSLEENEAEIREAEKNLQFQRFLYEVGPADMPLDVYPDPTGRYQIITKDMPREILLAACRVIGTHIHIGMPNHETALAVYNKVFSKWEDLCRMGDGSCGERLEIYTRMAPDFKPSYYPNWDNFYREAIQKGFELDPRKCWHLIRLSVHGTIEFRMFGTTRELKRIVTWAKYCHELCSRAYNDIVRK
jgi:gamma-glutamyl:cysteine ligase YbdK (ATP-grasp superfamily)